MSPGAGAVVSWAVTARSKRRLARGGPPGPPLCYIGRDVRACAGPKGAGMSTSNLSLVVALVWPLVLAGGAFLLRNFIGEWIKRRVEHDFNVKLEKLKSELGAEQKRLDDLRQTVLHGASARRVALDARRLQAVDNIWAGVMSFATWRIATAMLPSIDIKKAGEEVAKNPKVRQAFEMLGKPFDPKNMPPNPAIKERPFVSEVAWAYYQAYSSIISSAVMVIKGLEFGLDIGKFMKFDTVEQLVITALPHQTEYVKKWGLSGCSLLLDELETKLLEALREMLEGKASDEAALRGAQSITKAAEAVNTLVAEQAQEIAGK